MNSLKMSMTIKSFKIKNSLVILNKLFSSSEGTQDITIDGQNSTSSPMADTFHKQAEITW